MGSVRVSFQKQRLCLAPPVSTGGCGEGSRGPPGSGGLSSPGKRPCGVVGLCPRDVQADRWPLPWQSLPGTHGVTQPGCGKAPASGSQMPPPASGSREP